MSQTPKSTEPDKDVPPAAKGIIEETRVDEFAIGQFAAMGHAGLLPANTVRIYNEFKLRKDRLHPGRLTPEGFAFVDLLADIISSRFKATEA